MGITWEYGALLTDEEIEEAAKKARLGAVQARFEGNKRKARLLDTEADNWEATLRARRHNRGFRD